MKKNKHINYFAEEVKEDHTQPKGNANNTRNNDVVDPSDKVRLRNKIVKWVILAVILGVLVVIIYFACFAGNSTKINPSPTSFNITQDKDENHDKITIQTNPDGPTYVIHNLDNRPTYQPNNNSLIWANPYISNLGGYSKWLVYAKTDRGNICFYVEKETIVTGEPPAPITFYTINDQPITGQLETYISYAITNNMSIAQESPWLSFFMNLIPTLLLLGVMLWIMNRAMRMQGGGQGDEGSIFGIGKSQAKLAQSNVKFSDVAGIEEEKAELIEIVDYLKNPDKYAAMGARTPRGVILYGPPGTGKTLLAKAVAGEARVPFFQVSGSAFEDMLVGVGAKRVRDLFTKAKKAAPSIIFIDELDSVASKRGKFDVAGGGSGLADQTINQLLAEMDGFSTKTGVVVMAATNRLDVLDEAILRPGRFDRHIQVNLPDIKEREAILKIHSRNKNLSAKVHLEDIARRTPGFSGAQLENVLNEATLLAVRMGKSAIGMDEIDEAIDRVIAGPAKKSRVITDSEKKQIAYHEAGHALVGLHTPGSDVVEKITIIPRGQAAGYTLSTPEKQEIHIQKKSDLLSIVTAILGGRAAEEVIYGKSEISTGAANDLFKVTNIVRSMVTQLGMTDLGMTQYIPSEGQVNPYAAKLYSEQTAQKIDQEINDLIDAQYKKAKIIIEKNRKELDLIVEALILLETIVKNQIDYIHKNLKLPKEAIDKKNQNDKLAQEKYEQKLADKTKGTSKKEETSK
ncbi:MAG: ATP-dependent zinc metalloprotease FtsH [Mycoplasmataceae bacterium]|nr:ATP-dependent zinc metalloprotease FtsH [Mycoplasmataceae bacterium]